MTRQDFASKEIPISHDPFSDRIYNSVGKLFLRNLAHWCGELRTKLLIFNMFWLNRAPWDRQIQWLNSNGRLVDNGPSFAGVGVSGNRYIERRVQPWA